MEWWKQLFDQKMPSIELSSTSFQNSYRFSVESNPIAIHKMKLVIFCKKACLNHPSIAINWADQRIFIHPTDTDDIASRSLLPLTNTLMMFSAIASSIKLAIKSNVLKFRITDKLWQSSKWKKGEYITPRLINGWSNRFPPRYTLITQIILDCELRYWWWCSWR